MNQLEDFLTPTQAELFQSLGRMFGKTAICKKGKYILIPGEAPVMLIAHLDTVHKERVKQICKSDRGNILMSPQGIGGDDRCGVYALVTAHKLSPVKPWLLFTCDEEKGCVGADDFCVQHQKGKLPKKLDALKALVEIDRRGKNDAVYYDCNNPEFEAYITGKGFQTAAGSFSDISYIAPELGVAAVNLSAGYYNAHTLYEYIDRKQLNATVKKVVEIVRDAAKKDFPKYEYIERVWYWSCLGYGRYGGFLEDGGSGSPDEKIVWDYPSDGELSRLGVPDRLLGAYRELMDYYDFDELENIRADFGDGSILALYESEFGISYGDDGGAKWEKLSRFGDREDGKENG